MLAKCRICGRIGDVRPFQWYVDNHQPENVTIIMENTGIGDGKPEGLSFTLQGNTILKNWVNNTKLSILKIR